MTEKEMLTAFVKDINDGVEKLLAESRILQDYAQSMIEIQKQYIEIIEQL